MFEFSSDFGSKLHGFDPLVIKSDLILDEKQHYSTKRVNTRTATLGKTCFTSQLV